MTFVDYRDVAEAAAIAFTAGDLVNGTFELVAGGMVTRSELAALMTRYAGREVVAQDGDPSIALQSLPDASLRDGLARNVHRLALRTILGRTPRSLNDFFAELAR